MTDGTVALGVVALTSNLGIVEGKDWCVFVQPLRRKGQKGVAKTGDESLRS